MFVVLKSLYICNINDLGIRPTFLLQHILVACLNSWRCLAVWGAGQGECVGCLQGRRMRLLLCAVWESLLWYPRKVRNYSQEPGALFGPCGCSQTFPITSSFQFAQKLLCACAGTGYRQAQGIVTLCLICTWAVTPPISSCWTLRLQLHVSSTAELTAQGLTWVCRDTTNLTGEGELAEVSQLLSFRKWVSKNAWLHLSLPMLHGSHPLAGKPLVGSSYVYLGDYCARIMKSAKLRLEFQCRKEQREDVTEPCWERMVTPSTILITCFGLPASLCSLGNCA